VTPFDDTGAFCLQADGDGLRRLAVRGAGATVLSKSLAFVIQIVGTVVLARLLTPRDFGLVIMVTTFSLLLMNCGLNGFTEAVLQRDDIDHGLASNLFWINAGLGLALTLGFAAAGPLLAHLYGEPRVAAVATAIASTILFTSLSVQHLALLKRAMRFIDVAANDIVARAASVAVSIVLAWMGWGYWAMVAGTVALPLSTALGAFVLCRWLPGLPRRRPGTLAMVRFATNTYARFVLDYFTRNLDNLLVGWRFGPQSLGFYKKAYDLFVLPANQLSAPLTSVAVSALSRVSRDSTQHGRYFLSALSALAFIGMGVGAGLSLVGQDVISILLGPGWEESGRLFMFFGPGIGIMLVYGTHGWIHLSIGRADRWLRWAVVEFVVTGMFFLAGLHWGLAGVAVGWVLSFWTLTVPALWYAGRPARLGIAPLIGAVWKYALASALAGATVAVIIWASPPWDGAAGATATIGRIAATSLLFGALYLGVVIVLHGGCGPIRQLARLLRDMAGPARQERVRHVSEGVSSPSPVTES
jgi:O-antigen/teichoic acid export membrane protein